MWRRLSASKGAFSEHISNSYELVSTEDDDSINENHRLLTNGYRRQAATGNTNNLPRRANDNSLKRDQPNRDSNQNRFSYYRKHSGGDEVSSEGVEDGDNWSEGSGNSRKMLRRPSERDASRVSSVDNPNYCSVNMAMSVDDVPDATRTPPENRRTSSPYNVMSTADDSKSGESSGCFRALAKFLRCTCCCCFWLGNLCFGGNTLCDREIVLGQPMTGKFPPNVIKNQKYNIITFIPLVLFQQFKFFLNLYFLVMACSQFFPDIQIGYWYTYWGPLIFVLTVTLIREAIDDLRRRRRDKEINSQKYTKISNGEQTFIPSSNIKVGDMIIVEKDQRVPADMVLLRTSDKSASCFIRTDQLDGETDWKLRVPILQACENDNDLYNNTNQRFIVYAEHPQMDIHSFIGTLTKVPSCLIRIDLQDSIVVVPIKTITEDGETTEEHGISVENTMWANTVLAAGNAVGLVIYTGRETRSVMNNSTPRSKTGLIDLEINNLTKILFVAVIALAFLMICLKGFEGPWPRYMFRFVLLFSYIIPISLRVNMDMAKSFYAWAIQQDDSIRGTVARSTTIPEDLGRISYLLTDKTGTLTQNEMIFKSLVLATSTANCPEDIRDRLKQGLRLDPSKEGSLQRITETTRVTEAIKALAVCHNVTPVYDNTGENDEEMDVGVDREATYQASSPDEIALVKYAKEVGLSLVKRDQSHMILNSFLAGVSLEYQILHVFPFTSEAKRMGIIVKEKSSGTIFFYLKGADGVMKEIVKHNDWLDEACGNMAREGLRTLVVAKKVMSQHEYDDFDKKYNTAKSSKTDRQAQVYSTMCTIENNMDLLCVTGVEDTLQKDVKVTLETLRNAGIKIWMLTGDKLETATCIAKSSKLVSTQQEIYTFKEINDRTQAFTELNNFRKKSDTAMVIKGESLEICLKFHEREFMELACGCPVVIVCRCSPTQKARMVELVQKTTGKRAAAIGDGGNDVSMIQAADVGIGIEGKEGRQASLAADFSILQFSFVATLLLVHGRYSYKRSASLAQFVMHRGLIITVMQAVFSSIFYFSSVALYQGFLMIGYATVYTMLPVFALVLDKDVKEEDLLRLPELYAELGRGRSLTLKTFFLWVMISVYQGGILMYGALILFRDEFIHIVSISFTALIFTELIMVGLTIRNMHKLMIVAEVISFLIYVASLIVFRNYFDSDFILSINFMWKVSVITLMSCAPIFLLKYIRQVCAPPNYAKLN